MGRGKARKSLELIQAAYRILQEIQPASVRAVCYQLFILKLLADMSKNSTKEISRQLVWARNNDIVPMEWIADPSREDEINAGWDEPEEYIEQFESVYRKNYWSQQPVTIRVWSEKETVAGTLRPILQAYGVDFLPVHGWNSLRKLYDAALAAARIAKLDKTLILLYAGDFDPSGMGMTELDLPKRLAEQCDRFGLTYGVDLVLRRLTLLPTDLTLLPRETWFSVEEKKKDSRYAWFKRTYGDWCAELDAMNPNDLRARVEQAIVSYIDPSEWARCKIREREETQSFLDIANAWRQARGLS